MKHIDTQKLLDIVFKFKGKRILVLGDVMLDRYLYGTVERISPEAPVPIVKLISEEYRLGGAANVANNIKEMGGEVFLIGSCGNDSEGNTLKEILGKRQIPFFLFEKKDTTVKTRIISKGQQLLRLDKETIEEEFVDIETFKKLISHYQTVVVSDYGKGFVTEKILNILITSEDKRVLIDPKKRNFFKYKNCYLITPNKKETSQWWGREVTEKKEILDAGEYILDASNSKNLLITLGKDGMVVFLEDGSVWKIPAVVHNVFDVTGAGDVVISSLSLAIASGANLLNSSYISNIAAGISVGKPGTATVSVEEIINSLNKNSNYLTIDRWK